MTTVGVVLLTTFLASNVLQAGFRIGHLPRPTPIANKWLSFLVAGA